MIEIHESGVYIDGIKIYAFADNEIPEIRIYGNPNEIEAHRPVHVGGDVHGDVHAGGNVECLRVFGGCHRKWYRRVREFAPNAAK